MYDMGAGAGWGARYCIRGLQGQLAAAATKSGAEMNEKAARRYHLGETAVKPDILTNNEKAACRERGKNHAACT